MKFRIRCPYTKLCGHLGFHKEHNVLYYEVHTVVAEQDILSKEEFSNNSF